MINTKKNMFFSDGSGGKHFKEILERVRLQDAVNDGRKVRKIASVASFWEFCAPSFSSVQLQPGLSHNSSHRLQRQLEALV